MQKCPPSPCCWLHWANWDWKKTLRATQRRTKWIILQCSISLSNVHTLSTSTSISPLPIPRRAWLCTLAVFSSLTAAPSFSPPHPSELHPFLVPFPAFCTHLAQRVGSWVLQHACDSNKPHLIITPHTLYCTPSSPSDYERDLTISGTVRVEGATTCLCCQTASPSVRSARVT